MSLIRACCLSAALVLAGASAAAQTPAVPANARPLPPGLTRSGGVVMMAPISDSDSPAERGLTGPSERHASQYHVLSAADHDLYSKAFDAADRGDWIAAKGLADQGHNPTARKLIEWRYLLDKNSGASFDEINAFLKANPDWPLRDTLFARAERAMSDMMAPGAVLSWFGDRDPLTGIGKVRLGEAMIALGRVSAGRDLIRKAWVENTFEPDQEFAVLQRHADLFTPDIDQQRLNNLLWRDETGAARREMARVTASGQQLAQTRIALQSGSSASRKLVSELPETLRSDPGILFDRARLLRRSGNPDDEPDLLLRAPTRELAKINPGRWWAELNIATRQALQDTNYRTAYSLVKDTGLSTGENFAEAEFMAGWIALRYLKDPVAALSHFQKLSAGVSRPISAARAHYWSGRAYEAENDLGGAWREYRAAAQNPETYYGQLALARIDATPTLHLNDTNVDAASIRAAYENDDVVRGLRVLADLGADNLMRSFAAHYVELHPDAKYAKALASDLVQMGFRDIAVRVAKAASYNNVLMLAYSHPVIPLPAYKGPGAAPEPALVLGLIRQETEFDANAVSGAGAMGIMQMMPASARRAASQAGMPYRPNALLSDTDYNIQLGMTELSGNLADWGGSIVLSAAAYNAGPTNVKRWLDLYGDPRSPTTDPIDWIEQIPFSETRNYVQRVLENTEVYRNRLAGRDQPLQIMADLYRPRAPVVKVLPYVPPPPAGTIPGAVPVPEPKPSQAGGSTQEIASGKADPGALPKTKPVQ
ncbi:MAG TPA: lytic transglycosylase domain-containing protein [Rhizomicrobium sp.]|nr:lytic transglycosylase domain-containing protein [Rhizomicrobium sp.]